MRERGEENLIKRGRERTLEGKKNGKRRVTELYFEREKERDFPMDRNMDYSVHLSRCFVLLCWKVNYSEGEESYSSN